MEKWAGKTAVVTGAAMNIGAKISEDLVKHGVIVIGIDFTDENLKLMQETAMHLNTLHKGKLVPYKCDVRKQDEVINVFEYVNKNHNGVDILVNNAAVLHQGYIMNLDLDKIQDQVDTNIMGIVYCTRQAIDSMKNKSFGQIIMMNSVCGHAIPNFKLPKLNMYTITKHALSAFSKQLKLELRLHNIKVRCVSISPGLVDTSFSRVDEDVLDGEYFASMPVMTPGDVSDVVMYVLGTPTHIHVQEILFQALHDPY